MSRKSIDYSWILNKLECASEKVNIKQEISNIIEEMRVKVGDLMEEDQLQKVITAARGVPKRHGGLK